MTPSIIFVFSCFVGLVTSQLRCPSNLGWYKFEESCYRFEAYPKVSQRGALGICQRDGAHLLSINSGPEHQFIAKWLLENDLRRINWVTSGQTTSTGVEWQTDSSTTVTTHWMSNYASPNQTGLPVLYSYTGTEYGWNTSSVITHPYAFVCETRLNDVFKIIQEFRDFDYGLDVENARDAPRGPMFLREPQDTVVLGRISRIDLECLADGNPEPVYEWFMEKGKNNWVPVPTGGRYTLTTGKLEIENPISSDENTYQCKATNDVGQALSSFARLSFGELGDFSNVPPSTVAGAEYDGAQLVCPEIRAKPSAVFQWYKNSPTSFIRPNFQKHIFMSMNGKLYFSELAPSDAATYHCVANLYAHGFGGKTLSVSSDSRTSLGFKLAVTSGGGSEFQPVIQNGFPFVFPESPVKGGDVRLECFAYGTGPLIYSWKRKDGKPLPYNHVYGSNKRILLLTNVELLDGGVYECHVMSTTTKQADSEPVNLVIQARPYFTYPLSHMHMDVGSRLSWHCEAEGMPAPTYSWYKDGKPFNGDSAAGIIVEVNSMTIESVEVKRDSAVYQCAATNQYGTTFSTAQIRVLEIAPSFEKQPMTKSKSAARRGQVTLICSPVAAPTPSHRWLKDGSDLNLDPNAPESETDHYRMLHNGNLIIQGITNGDQGRYTCEVENEFGKASDYTDLLVLDGTVISDPPADDKVEVNLTATLLCRASHAPEIDMIYVWSFNDHVIDYFIEPEYRQGEGNMRGSLYIVAAQFRHEGSYTCTATTAMDSSSRSAYLEVLGPPGEPSGVSVKTAASVLSGEPDPSNSPNQGANSQRPGTKTTRWVVWTDGQRHGSDITHYFVEFRTEFDMRWRVHPDADNIPKYMVQNDNFPNQQVAKLTNLKAFATMEFRVRARNSFGIGNPSLPTEKTQIAGTNVSVKVQNVRGGGGSIGDLTVAWDPIAREDYNGPDLKYRVFWRPYDPNQEDAQWSYFTLKHEEACRYRTDFLTGQVYPCDYVAYVDDTNFFLPYETKVMAMNAIGNGPETESVTVMSAERLPLGSPQIVKGFWYNGTALLITWTPVPNTRDDAGGNLRGYKINYWRRDLDEEEDALQNIINLKPGQENINSGLIIGLEPVMWYKFNVQAYNSAGNGDKSSDYERQTLNRPPGNYPTEVHVFSVEGFGVRVNFRGISTQAREEPLKGYVVQYWKANENFRSALEANFGLMTTGVIRNLSANAVYRLRVLGYSRAGMGRKSSPSIFFTVGDGQIVVDPFTTELMNGTSALTMSLILCVCALAIALVRRFE